MKKSNENNITADVENINLFRILWLLACLNYLIKKTKFFSIIGHQLTDSERRELLATAACVFVAAQLRSQKFEGNLRWVSWAVFSWTLCKVAILLYILVAGRSLSQICFSMSFVLLAGERALRGTWQQPYKHFLKIHFICVY